MGRKSVARCADNARQRARSGSASALTPECSGFRSARYFAEVLERRVQLSAYIVGSATAYPTIQAAVDAAAPLSVITVDPGTYSELVTVGKGLTIRGAQAGIDARTNARQAGTSESVVNGSTGGSGQSSGFYITGNDVTIDGFTVQGNTSPSAYGAGIVIAPGKSGTHILNNIIQNNIAGMYLANASATDPAVIQYNVFSNNNNAGSNGGRGIYTDGGISGGVLTNVTIDANFFFHNYGGTGTTGMEAAIALQSGSSTQSNIRITNNTFDGNGKALLAYNASGLTIQGNTITDSSDVDSGALRFEGGVSSVVIESNNIFNNASPAIRIDSKVVGTASGGFTLNYNNIYGNGYVDIASPPPGIQPGSVIVAAGTYTGAFNAQNNWWGASNGPGGDGGGSGDVLRANGASVTYTPYSTTAVVTQQSAFTGLAQVPDSQIQAVTFDQGGSGFGYQVTGSVNATMPYRATAVTTETTADPGSAYDVAYDVANMKAGQWLAYSVNVRVSGTYRLDFRVANASAGGTLHATLDGITVGGTLNVPNTGGAQVWQTVSTANFSQTVGPHTLKVLFDSNGSGGSAASLHWVKLVTVSANGVVPTAPANLVAIPVKGSLVDLTWSNTAVNQTGFTVERSTDGSNFTTLAALGATTTAYSDPGLAPNRTYYYRVKATNSVGASDPSSVATVVTPVPPSVTQLSDVTWVSATTGFGTIHLDLSINGNPITLRGTVYPRGVGTHAVSQIVYNLGGAYSGFTSDIGIDDEVAGNGSVIFQVLGDNNAVLYTSGTLTKLSAVVHVNVSVVGVQQLTLVAGDAGDGNLYDHADWAGPTLIQGAPPAPTSLQAASQPNQVALTWAASLGASTYNLYRGTSAGGEGASPIATNVAATNYLDTSVTAGVTYYYNVAAVNAGGTSGRSNEASAAPTGSQAPAAPTGVQAYPGIKQISLSWPAVAGATSYNVYRGTTVGGEGATAYATGINGTGFTDASVSTSTTYYYKVTAVNSFGESPRSAEVNGATLVAPAHVVIVVEENKDVGNILGFPSAVYINSLISQGAFFTNFHAVAHPSQPNYIALFSGSTMGVTDDTVPPVQFNAPNLATQLLAAGLTFTGYSEDLPAVGSLAETGGPLDSIGVPAYARKHNPWSDFSNVPGTLNQPFTAFPGNYDLLPTVSFVIPNLDNDMHDAPVSVGDTWLQNNLGAYATWAKTHNSLLVVTWDENDTGDNLNTIPTVIVGQQIKPGTYNESTGLYGLLRTIEDLYNLPALGGASTAAAIQDIWAAAPVAQTPAAPTGVTPTPGVTQMTLDWQASSGATSYSVYRGTTAGGEGASPIASGIATTHFVDNGVSPGTTYYYQVTASNAAGEGARSTEISTTTLKASPTFSGLTASSSVTYGTLTVSLSGTISAGTLFPSGSVSITISGGQTGTTINIANGTFTTNFDTHLLPASGTAYTVTYSFAGNSSFNSASDTSKTLTVNPRSLTVTATGTNRVYDGTTSTTVTLQDNRVNGDALTLTYASALFANKAVGSGKSINVTGIGLSGTAASNYTLSNTSTTATANIMVRPLTVTVTGVNRVYDGTTSATVTLSDNRIAGDVFTDSYASATFASKTVGTAKTITVTGIAVTGTDAGNYSQNTSTTATANITQRSLTVSATGVNKIYDGTSTATVTLGDDRVAGDVFTDSYTAASFANKNVGTGKAVSVGGIGISGTDAANYAAPNATANTTANITQRALTVTATGVNKVYDGTTIATVTLGDNRVVGDVLITSYGGATFAGKNVGTAKPVSVTGISVTGTDAGNYTFNSTASASADVTARSLTVTAVGVNKVYDATTSATVTLSDNRIAGDVLTDSYGSAAFASKSVGAGKTVTVNSIAITGADSGNYSLSNTTAATTASITALSISGSVTASNKTYDATTAASISSRNLTGVLGADVVSLSGGTATFDTKNVGTGKTVSVTGLYLTGADSGNYALASTSATPSANITAATVTPSVTALDKSYDTTTAATIGTRNLAGVFGADVVGLAGSSATFDTRDVGVGKMVTATGLSLTGADAGNYTLSSTSATTTASINAVSINGSVTALNKTYDGTAAATIASRNVTGVLSGDVVGLAGGTATFDTRNVGNNKTVTATGLSLSGADAGNYTLASSTLTAAANITAATVTPTVGVSNRQYDTTNVAAISARSLAGVLGSDDITLAVGTATFDTKNVGIGKAVLVTGLSVTGDDAGNYALSSSSISTTASISAAPVSGSFSAAGKPYDATTAAGITGRGLSGVMGLDSVTMVGGTATFDTKNVGTGKTVTATGFSLTGPDAGNYTLANPTETTTADITPQVVLNGTAGPDDLRLVLDTNPQFLDWFVYSGGVPVHLGQLAATDPGGLTINGLGSTDTLLLNYANGSPLPSTLHLNGTFMVNGLAPTPTALANTNLEIGNSTVYFAYAGQTPAAVIRRALAQGYNSGTWTGSATASTGAIVSTNAASGPPGVFGIGYADSADGIVAGQPANTVEVRYTVMGDANLDRVVDINDATRLQTDFGAASSPAWDLGNFNFDSAIDFLDAILVARNYSLTASGAAAAQIVAGGSLTSASSSSSGSSTGGLTAGTTPPMEATPTSTTTAPTGTTIGTTTNPIVTSTGSISPTASATHPTRNRYPVSVELRPDGKDNEDRPDRRRDDRRRSGR